MSVPFPGQKYWGRLIGDSLPQKDRNQVLVRDNNLARGLIGCWRFKEGAGEFVFDDSGFNNKGTLGNGVEANKPTWVQQGKNGSWCLNFDNVDDSIAVPSVVIGTSHTASWWMRVDTGGDATIISNTTANRYIGYFDGTSIYYHTGSAFVSVPHGGFTLEIWYYISITRNLATVKFYKNAQQIGSTQTLGGDETATWTIDFFGREGSGFYFGGLLDDVRIYNRVLTLDEIKQIYEEGIK